jgi:hypothetical protein
MNLSDVRENIKSAPDVSPKIFLILTIISFITLMYLLWRFSAFEETRKNDLRIVLLPTQGTAGNTSIDLTNKLNSSEDWMPYIASTEGKVFHFLWCPGAKNIKQENAIRFRTKEEALASGRTPARNCPGL